MINVPLPEEVVGEEQMLRVGLSVEATHDYLLQHMDLKVVDAKIAFYLPMLGYIAVEVLCVQD